MHRSIARFTACLCFYVLFARLQLWKSGIFKSNIKFPAGLPKSPLPARKGKVHSHLLKQPLSIGSGHDGGDYKIAEKRENQRNFEIMPVCKVDKKNGFTIMSNGLLRDKRISMKSRGLLAYILSLPEDWDYTIAGLSIASGMGKKALASGLTELEKAGYLERRMLRAGDGTFLDVEYVFHEEPINASRGGSPAELTPEAALIGRDQP